MQRDLQLHDGRLRRREDGHAVRVGGQQRRHRAPGKRALLPAVVGRVAALGVAWWFRVNEKEWARRRLIGPAAASDAPLGMPARRFECAGLVRATEQAPVAPGWAASLAGCRLPVPGRCCPHRTDCRGTPHMNFRGTFPESSGGELGFERFSRGAELPVRAEGRVIELAGSSCASPSEADPTLCLPILNLLLHAAWLLRRGAASPTGPRPRRLEAHFA